MRRATVIGYLLALAMSGRALAQQVAGLICRTVNGEITAEQLRFELAAAGYSGPWDDWATETAYTRVLGAR